MRIKLFYVLLVSSLLIMQVASGQTRIACVGASITSGATLPNPAQDSWPGQLQKLLGSGYTVNNFGVSGTTLLRKGNLPYWATEAYKQALASNPAIVCIDLGGNDSKLINRVHLDEYIQDYHDMIQSFTQLPSHPRIVLLLPAPSFVIDTTGIWDPVITSRIIPLTRQVAYREQVEVVDIHSSLVDKEANMPDKIHPDITGSGIMARRLYDVITQKRDAGFDIIKKLNRQVTNQSFYGYTCADFVMDGHDCKVVQPRKVAAGHPWIWRARFWGHEPQTDIALLERGFHVVYCDVAELFGNDEAITRWNNFYHLLVNAGLGKKAVMEGMSRGGVYVFNWAAANPEKVACVYVDNPVLDLKSWPGVQGKAVYDKASLDAFKVDYHLDNDTAIKNFKGSPVDKVAAIVKGRYPILVLVADADELLPPSENTLVFEEKIKALKGDITVIHKAGFKHHPHSFPNPTPIVDFITKAVFAK